MLSFAPTLRGIGGIRAKHCRGLAVETKMAHKSALDDVGKDGSFQRKQSQFRSFINKDGEFPAEAGRYHLYVSYACPWAHRTLITRKLKGLEDAIGVTVVDHFMGEMGWTFGTYQDEPLYGLKYIRELYFKAEEGYAGRFTVPVLWDKQKETIVNNESSEIIVMLNGEFNEFAKNPEVDLYPESQTDLIQQTAESFYDAVNNGVYKCGFATTQEAYETAFHALFAKLDELEEILSKSRFLTGNTMTLADVRLFTTLVRFDAVYITHFKCNLKRISDYPNLFGYVCDIYQTEGISETVNFEHIKKHYFMSHKKINPIGLVPVGPALDFSVPHNRHTIGQQ